MRGKKQNQFCYARAAALSVAPVIPRPTLELEDEVGDVLEKAIRRSGLPADAVAARAEVGAARLRDALDYRSELSCDELRRLASVLKLNEVGLCALGSGRYPLPPIGALPFSVWPLRMPHGVGVANAYLIAECGSSHAILFDTGAGIAALETAWPSAVRHLDAVFLTHVEPEHAGGLCDIVARFGSPEAFVPVGAHAPCGQPMAEGAIKRYRDLEVTAFTTPGHAAAHSCYLVRHAMETSASAVLVSGDLIFAGSVGGAYFSHEQLQLHLRRLMQATSPRTMIAPGHGPLTTVENELRYNPFVG